jgi:DNA-binding NarL/FixJ family response regulator
MKPSDKNAIAVLLVTDSFLIGDGLAALLFAVPDVDVIGRARGYNEMLFQCAELTPDAVIISIRSPVISTMATLVVARRLRAEYPGLDIVVIADRGNGFALELLRGGADRVAYLLDEHLPTVDCVLDALRSLRRGEPVLGPAAFDDPVGHGVDAELRGFTGREVDVLEQIAHGLSNRAVAAELEVSTKSVEKYVTVIFRKLGLADQSLVDRRVAASLTYLRSRALPLRTG